MTRGGAVGTFEELPPGLPPLLSERAACDRYQYTIELSRHQGETELRGFVTLNPSYPPADFDSVATIG
jgi:hypothetical protein